MNKLNRIIFFFCAGCFCAELNISWLGMIAACIALIIYIEAMFPSGSQKK